MNFSAVADGLSSQPAVFITLCTLLGLMVGSFLNVVIHRLPIMQQRDAKRWAAAIQSAENFTAENDAESTDERYDLMWPASHCPSCQHKISPLENIPLLSWLLLRGRCRKCKTPISKRYPFIELLCGLLSAVVAWKFGFGWEALGGLLLTWALVSLAAIDFDEQILPDAITLPWLWLGLVFSLFADLSEPAASIIGAVIGYGSLWLLYHGYRLLTGKEGLGYGDFKLLAMLGAWLGWQQLPMIILLSSAVGALVGGALIASGKLNRENPMPFGPVLAAAGWLALVGGPALTSAYFSLFGL